ncbi:MAG: hypothetical protein HN742_28980 [Lentisphaerae bacterium]|nr:hypothetical protein [Lentisphaerota bacterium]MBT4822953.1 hypothetical protein [Lentisphaerota bacterium]MBT5609510.1 hypothetical protein [Lentisphaerota bacterium]MBT7058492.1 hypothetical protein [Lentisphaerota bacterium]MBT7845942.1 hypothetical protein [Lentisphaerota bacterium]
MASLKRRSQFYGNLATLEDAGLPRIRALKQGHPEPFGQIAAELAETIAVEGLPMSEAMRGQPRLFSTMECSLVEVGERTGNAELVFRSLADWFELLRTLRGQMITGLIYPFLQYHVAAILLPLISYFAGSITGEPITIFQAVCRCALLLGVPYAILFLLFVVRPRLFPTGLPLPPWVSACVLEIPLIGGLSKKLDNTRFFRALALSWRSGLGTVEAVALAADSCGNSWTRGRFHRVSEQIAEEGCTFVEAYRSQFTPREQNAMVVSMLETGEMSGASDEMAERVARVCGEEAEQTLKRVSTIVPLIFYFLMAGYIAYQIIMFYKRIVFDAINSYL